LSGSFTAFNRNVDINVWRAVLGRNAGVNIAGAAYEACSATWNLGTNSALLRIKLFCLFPVSYRKPNREHEDIVAYSLKARIVRAQQPVVTRQQGK
jgi:hypothetical protein